MLSVTTGAAGIEQPPASAEVREVPPSSTTPIEILSHELRSPITTIQLGAKVLRRNARRRVRRRMADEVVAAVEMEAERLLRLVEDLLAIARHETGAPLLGEPLLIQHFLPGVLEQEIAAGPGIAIWSDLPADLPAVVADDAALRQVIRNLVANAARFGPKGGQVEVVATREADEVVITVLDRGPGIDPADADRVFEPFYRVPRPESPGGAGLGLTAVQRLLAAMNGRIELGRRDGGGASVAVRLPIARPED